MEHGRALGIAVTLSVATSACGTDRLEPVTAPDSDVTSVCVLDTDCPPGTVCDRGECVPPSSPPPTDPPPPDPPPSDPPPTDPPPVDPPPSDPPPEPPVQTTGDWQTQYHLDWSAYLGFLEGMAEPIDTLDQILIGNLDIPYLDGLISDLLQEYTPDWVGNLVHILNNVVHFFEDVAIDGRLHLDPATAASARASEVWLRGTVHVITMCPEGELSPTYPACAQIEVPLDPLDEDYAYVAVDPQPFDVVVATGEPLRISNREVRMQLARFIAYVIDQLVAWTTDDAYANLEDALGALVDCAALRTEVEASVGLSFPEVEEACVAAVTIVSDEVLARLDDTYDWEVMRFSQSADVLDDDDDGVADRLGDPSSPGVVFDGEFELLRNAVLSGAWTGERL